MPSYDYICKNCNETFTIQKSMNDTSIPDCLKCSSSDVSRIWGGFIIKGSQGSSQKSCTSCNGGSCSTCH